MATSALGPTHGAVVDRQGRQHLYECPKRGRRFFTRRRKSSTAYLGAEYSNIHDMEIRQEDEGEFIYGARNNDAEGIKFNIELAGDRSEASVS